VLNFDTFCFTVKLSFSLASFGYITIKVWLSFYVRAHLSSTKTAYIVLGGSLNSRKIYKITKLRWAAHVIRMDTIRTV